MGLGVGATRVCYSLGREAGWGLQTVVLTAVGPSWPTSHAGPQWALQPLCLGKRLGLAQPCRNPWPGLASRARVNSLEALGQPTAEAAPPWTAGKLRLSMGFALGSGPS